MSELADIVAAAAAVVAALTGIVMCYQIIQVKRHFGEEHRVARNVRSNELIRWWVEQIARETSSARIFVEHLSAKECKALADNEVLTIALPVTDQKHRGFCLEKLNICLGDAYSRVVLDGDLVKIPASEAAKVRSHCIKYLNSTETVMSAWRHHLVDRETIKEEFAYLVHMGKQFKLLENFREASGGVETYPAIYEFIVRIQPPPSEGQKPASP